MPPAGSEPTIPSSECPQTHTLDRAATGIDIFVRIGLHMRAEYLEMSVYERGPDCEPVSGLRPRVYTTSV